MVTIIRNVRDLDPSERSALERLAGRPLCDRQRFTLQIADDDSPGPAVGTADDVPSWWNVYEGLTDEEVDRLDEAVRRRADLTRPLG
jgi:hypothetical protein